MDYDDYRQLPIPFWLEIACPRCDYALCGLPSHVCSECGLVFDVDDLMTDAHPRHAPRVTTETRPLPDMGLRCHACDQPLAGASDNVCPHCHELFDLEGLLPDSKWVSIARARTPAQLVPLIVLLRHEGLPCDYPEEVLSTRPMRLFRGRLIQVRVRRDYYFDALAVLAEQQARLVEGGNWICPGCGENVPGHFDVCWKCQTERDLPQTPPGV